MKKWLSAIWLIGCMPLYAQGLHYFVINDDSKDTQSVGVKNAQGDIVIPAKFRNFYLPKEDGQPVGNDVILMSFPHNPAEPRLSVYDSNGRFLYAGYWFDNGLDYFAEGKTRFDENGKVGFVNRDHQKIIPAQFDYATPFHYGYAQYCNGCKENFDDPEHPYYTGGDWGVINENGKKVEGRPQAQHADDIRIDGLFYPNPFRHSAKERQLLGYFDAFRTDLSEYCGVKSETAQNFPSVQIVARPSAKHKNYLIQFFAHRDGDIQPCNYGDWTMSMDGKEVYRLDFDGNPENFATRIQEMKHEK